jgi:hypothetical protein
MTVAGFAPGTPGTPGTPEARPAARLLPELTEPDLIYAPENPC